MKNHYTREKFLLQARKLPYGEGELLKSIAGITDKLNLTRKDLPFIQKMNDRPDTRVALN